MVTFKFVISLMPSFFYTEYFLISMRLVATYVITSLIVFFYFLIKWNFPILRIPIILTEPFIKYFIFFWIESFFTMFDLRIKLSSTILWPRTFFYMIMSPSFSFTRIRTSFRCCRISKSKGSFITFKHYFYFLTFL